MAEEGNSSLLKAEAMIGMRKVLSGRGGAWEVEAIMVEEGVLAMVEEGG